MEDVINLCAILNFATVAGNRTHYSRRSSSDANRTHFIGMATTLSPRPVGACAATRAFQRACEAPGAEQHA
jgi:hypothetical protein